MGSSWWVLTAARARSWIESRRCVSGSTGQDHWVGEPTVGDAAGGQGGRPFRAVCPRDTAVKGFSAVGSEFVVNVRLVCSFPLRPKETAAVLPAVGGHPELGSTAGATCRDLAFSATIRGSASQFVNRFGLDCDVSYLDTPLPVPVTVGEQSTREVPARVYVPTKGRPKGKTSIFAVAENGGDMLFSIYMGLQAPSRAWARRDVKFGTGWGFRHLFSAGDGVIIAITTEGKVLYYKCECMHGDPSWIVGEPKTIAEGWPEYRRVFSGGHGIIYTLDWKGNLYYNAFLGLEDGSPRWGTTRKLIDNQWNDIATAFASGDDGTIFAVTNNMDLLSFPLRRPVHRRDDVERAPQEGRHRMGLPSPLLTGCRGNPGGGLRRHHALV